ncbi:hypothetical protein ACQKLP_01630 [Chitinophaga sp. NPDC101104]|uniref:hypothetical protein n=1 Tax=Chitinophaga sp. NPDC101104 TaxID=3390561 RepID=UPI003CFC1953
MLKFFDKDGNELTEHDLQDKTYWCNRGETMEKAFVSLYGDITAYDINPKKKGDKYALDFISVKTKILADLKSQHRPFFTSGETYNIDSQHAVTFNVKDKRRYEQNFPGMDVIYFIDWVAVRMLNTETQKEWTVNPMLGIYKISFRVFKEILSKAPVHKYKQRENDRMGNARDSYVIDIRNNAFEKLL